MATVNRTLKSSRTNLTEEEKLTKATAGHKRRENAIINLAAAVREEKHGRVGATKTIIVQY